MQRVEVLPVTVSGYSQYRWAEPQRWNGGKVRWYYGISLPQRHQGSLHVDPSSVDQALRPLVSLLHDQGIPTTPSCSGHFGSRGHHRIEVYRQLQHDAAMIRGHGLTLKCLETGKLYSVRDPLYRLPPLHVFQQMSDPPGTGGIGLVFRPGDPRITQYSTVLRRISGVSVSLRCGADHVELLIKTQAKTPAQMRRLWKRITGAILPR